MQPLLCITFFKITIPIISRISLTFNERVQRTHPIIIVSAKHWALGCIVHEDPNIILLNPILSLFTMNFLNNHPRRKRDDLSRNPHPLLICLFWIQLFLVIEKAHGRVHCNQDRVVCKIDVESLAQRESFGRGIQGTICLGFVLDGRTGETSDKFVYVANALDAA